MKTQSNPLESKPWRPDCWLTVKGVVCTKHHVNSVMPLSVVKATCLTTAMIKRIINTRHPFNESPWLYGFWITPIDTLIDAESPDSILANSMKRAVVHTMAAIEKMMEK